MSYKNLTINGRNKIEVLSNEGYSSRRKAKILSGIKINDYLYENKKGIWFKGKRIKNKNTRGTGCTLSSTIAANLAKGYDMENSIKMAKEFLSNALLDMLDLGKGSGPMNHAFDIKNYVKSKSGFDFVFLLKSFTFFIGKLKLKNKKGKTYFYQL